MSRVVLCVILFWAPLGAQGIVHDVDDGISARKSTLGGFHFQVFNNGSMFSDAHSLVDPGKPFGGWPGDFDWKITFQSGGFWFACKKGNRDLVSINNYRIVDGPVIQPNKTFANSFVPGSTQDPLAKPDTAFRREGWKYTRDENYIVYVSSDYDKLGTDISGNNFPDWPVRKVDGKEMYVLSMQNRSNYHPVFKSEQDIFAVFKDTETSVDPEYRSPYANPDSFSVPVGIEVREHCYLWSSKYGSLKNTAIFLFEILNESDQTLDSCFSGLDFDVYLLSNNSLSHPYPHVTRFFDDSRPQRNLFVQFNPDTLLGTSLPFPHILYMATKILQDSSANVTSPLALSVLKGVHYGGPYTAKKRYERITSRPTVEPPYSGIDTVPSRMIGTGPLFIQPGKSVTVSLALLFGVGIDRLLLTDDYVTRVYQNGFKVPVPPFSPTFKLSSAQEGVFIQWDTVSQTSLDPIVPDSLGIPFLGYRLYRARVAKGPYLLIKEWQVGRDSIVHEYVDRGQDGKDTILSTRSGLANNIPFYYKLTAYDEGAPLLELPSMESTSEVKSITLSGLPSSPYALENIRIVPNPYIVTHAAQQSIDHPKLFFNYLPEECTIRIYTVALELVAELHHHGGSAEEWDLHTQGGQQVASQLLIAQIETPQGTAVVKKFAVVLAE